MAASVVLAERNGTSPGVETLDIANVNMGAVDASGLNPTSYPLTAAADSHSYEKYLRLCVTSMGGATQIDNIKCWLSDLGGGYKAGEGMSTNLKTSGYSPATYATPVGTNSSVADQVMPTSEPANANVGIGGSLSGVIAAAPSYTDYMVFQLDVDVSTPAGSLNQKTFTYQWDEQ
jgi:hypothetical protein